MRIVPLFLLSLAFGASTVVAQTRSVYIEDLTWPEIRDAIAGGKTSAIIYAGSTEQNGAHMALGKHNVIAHYAAGRIAESLGNALVYPTLPFALAGDSNPKSGHMRFPGTVSLSSEVFLAVVRQVTLSAIAAGFKNVFLMGDHGGGQAELKLAAGGLDAQWRSTGTRIFYIPDLYVKSGEQINTYLVARGIRTGGHAGASDTSQVLFLDNDRKWIRRDQLGYKDAAQEAAMGIDGDPSKASAEMGRMFIDFKVTSAVEQIRRLLKEPR
jgi:creatinine amidohydrolase/Fe(II)-dependent formamide hydrolase-like protein